MHLPSPLARYCIVLTFLIAALMSSPFLESICYGEEISPPFKRHMSCVFAGGCVDLEISTYG